MTTVTAPLDIPAILHADAACLIGPAGTGKTTLARRLVQEWPGTVLAATTGIASVNLGEGTTINALLRYFDTASLVESYTAGFLTAQFGKLWKAGVRRIILDEVSMLDAEQLTCFARALDELAGRRYVTDVAMQDEITDAQDQEEDRAEDGLRRWPIKLLLTGDWCLGRGTPVTLADGTLVPVEDIYPGMQVMGPDSQPRTVLRTKSAIGALYRVDQTNGDSYVVNALHPIALRRSLDGQRCEWGTSKVMQTPGATGRRYPRYPDVFTLPAQVLAEQPRKFRECFVGYKAGCLHLPERPVRVDPYFLGLWLGDGDSDAPRVTTADPEVKAYCAEYARTLGLKITVGTWARTRAERVGLSKRKKGNATNPLLTLLRSYDLIGNKHIPTDYLLNAEEVRLQLLAGLLDSDGCWSGNRYTFTATNEKLALQVKQLADHLGFRAAKHPAQQPFAWRVTIGGATWRIPCRIARKQSRMRDLGRSRLTSTLTVTPIGLGEYVGLQIDGDQLFVLGDGTVTHNCQLPPVKAPFAFESPEWERFGAHAHLLTTIYRQTDPAFLEALWAARRGDPDPVCDYFGGRLASSTQHDFEGVTLFARNEEVDRYNRLRLDRVTGTAETYTPTRWGAQRGDWKNIPDALTLKVGATVMILANKREEEGDLTLGARLVYANGDLGVITDLTRTGAWVQLHRTGEAVLVDPVTRRNEIPLEPGRREALRADGHPERIRDKFEVIGAVTYLPLRIAYGTTIHKCQGLTLDTVQINTRDHFFRTPGMAYVSLSRCRTPEGIRLVGTVDGLRRGVTVHPKLRGWI